jgi:ATP-binding cassette subfamily C protein
MLKILIRAMKYMTKTERISFLMLLTFRASVAFIDLVSILAIGFLATSVALFVTEGSDPTRSVEIAGFAIEAIDSDNVPVFALIVIALFTSKAIISIELTRRLANFLAKIEARASRDIASSAFGRGLEGMRNHSRDEVLFAALSGSPSAFNALLNSIGSLVAEGFLFIVVLATFMVISPAVAITAMLFFGFIGLVIQFFIGRELEKTSSKVNEQAVISSRSLLDLGEVYKEATILGRQAFFIENLYKSRLASTKGIAYQIVLNGMPRYIVETSLMVGIALFIISQISSGDLVSTAATIGIFLTGGLRLTAALLPLQSALLTIKQAMPAANRAMSFLEGIERLTPLQAVSSYAPKGAKGVSVSVRDVSFAYGNSTPAVNDVSLEISAGSQVAFIGLSGAGKSTLADLILGLLEPNSGEVTLDGNRPSHLIAQNPGLLGYVPQKPGMVSGTIADNILLGIDPSVVDQNQLLKAIDLANLSNLIDSLPDGIHTQMGKHRDQFSGGQLQRIGLARALYTKPRLLIMDEATSALDAESEHEINLGLDRMRGEVTVVLIAHRLNTVQRSDMVHLITNGELEDSGSFHELLKRNPKVQNLAMLMAIDREGDA